MSREEIERRAFLEKVLAGCAVAATGSIWAACGGQEEGGEQEQPQGCVTMGQEPPEGEALVELRLDLEDPANAPLTRTDGGTLSLHRGDIPGLPEKTVSVARLGESEVVAVGTCPHLACALRWDRQRDHFVCPCHQSEFERDGSLLPGVGPACTDATSFEARLEGGVVVVTFRG